MRIDLDEDIGEEPDEEIGAMVAPPLVGVLPKAQEDSTHYILVQLESDIAVQALENSKKAPIEKNLLNHFKEIQVKAIQIQREKEKEDKK